jgi:GTPase SAR1 family protein
MQTTKILIIGDAGVGKTAIVNRIINGEFNPKYIADNKVTTHDVGYFKITLFPRQFKNRFSKLIYDSEEHNIQYDRIIIMCDINNTMSFDNKNEWLKLTRGLCHKNTCIILCINKCDAEGEYFSYEWIDNVFKKYGFVPFMSESATRSIEAFDGVYYMSAKTNQNIHNILEDTCKQITISS